MKNEKLKKYIIHEIRHGKSKRKMCQEKNNPDHWTTSYWDGYIMALCTILIEIEGEQ